MLVTAQKQILLTLVDKPQYDLISRFSSQEKFLITKYKTSFTNNLRIRVTYFKENVDGLEMRLQRFDVFIKLMV